jgi:hypothetical protein
MFDVLSNPLAPCFVLILVAGLAAGFQWGARSEQNRIGDDLDMLGRFRIGGFLFEGKCVGHIDDVGDDNDEVDGDPHTVEDLLK